MMGKRLNKQKILDFAWLLFRFALAGLPSFLIAIPLNWFLVEQAELIKPVAYLLTLVLQVTINFFLLRRFVFVAEESGNIFMMYMKFVWGISFFRFLDWGLYTILVKYTDIHYLLIQFGNVLIFSVAKFLFSRKVMAKNTDA